MTKLRTIKDDEPFLRGALEKRLGELYPRLVAQVLYANAIKVKHGYKGPAFWVYELRHYNGKATSARSMDKCCERFAVICAAARLTGWQPPTTARTGGFASALANLTQQQKDLWSKSLYTPIGNLSFVKQSLSGKSATKVIVDDLLP